MVELLAYLVLGAVTFAAGLLAGVAIVKVADISWRIWHGHD